MSKESLCRRISWDPEGEHHGLSFSPEEISISGSFTNQPEYEKILVEGARPMDNQQFDSVGDAIVDNPEEQACNEEAYYYSILANFEELVNRYGGEKVMSDLDDAVLLQLQVGTF